MSKFQIKENKYLIKGLSKEHLANKDFDKFMQNKSHQQGGEEMFLDIQRMIILLSVFIKPNTKGEDYLNELKFKYVQDVKEK